MQSKINPAARLASMQEYFFALANQKISTLTQEGKDVINLGIGSPDLAPPSTVIKELQRKSQDPKLHCYPSYFGLPEFKEAIAKWYDREYQITLEVNQEILPTAGSKEGIVMVTLAFIDQGDEVLVPDPGYATYSRGAIIAGGKARTFPLLAENGYLPDLEALEREDLSRVKLMWINYPNNPTGAVASHEDLTKIVAFGRKHSIIIASDNPYSHTIFNQEKAASILELPAAKGIAIELNSLSKTYNMAGWRIGWIATDPTLMKPIANIYSNIETGLFLPIQYAGAIALATPQSWLEEQKIVYQERRQIIVELLQTLECQVYDSPASLYVWAKLPDHIKVAEKYCFELVEKTGVFLTPGTAFGAASEGYIRASICQDKSRLQQALNRIKDST